MAVGASNPFYIKPAQANINPVLSGFGSMTKESRAENKRKADTDLLMEAYKSGDPDKIASLLASNPELSKQLSSMIGFKDQASEDNYRDTVRKLSGTIDPETRGQILVDRIDYVNSQGGNPVQSVTMLDQLQRNPEQFDKNLDIEFASTQGKQAWDAYKGQRGLGADNFKSKEFDLKKETLKQRKLESELRRQEIQQKRSDTQVNRDATQQKIDKIKTELAQKKKEVKGKYKDALDASDSAVDAVNRLINHPGLESAVGFGSSFPTVPGSESADFEAALESFDAKLFSTAIKQMVGMGSLSDAEGKKVSASVGTLNKNMSDEAMKESLGFILESIQKGRQNTLDKMEPEDRPAQAADQGQGATEGATATNPQTGEKVIFKNGQWQPST